MVPILVAKPTRVVRILIGANVAVFLLGFAAPRLTNALVWVPTVFFERPWTVLTYMFLHGELAHLGFNLLGLYVFGSTVEREMGPGPFTMLYIVSGCLGALFPMAFSNNIAVIGASAGVFGLMAPFARSVTPINASTTFPVRAQLLAILIVASSIWTGIGGLGGNAALLTHLGGFLGGYFYRMLWERRRTIANRSRTNR